MNDDYTTPDAATTATVLADPSDSPYSLGAYLVSLPADAGMGSLTVKVAWVTAWASEAVALASVLRGFRHGQTVTVERSRQKARAIDALYVQWSQLMGGINAILDDEDTSILDKLAFLPDRHLVADAIMNGANALANHADTLQLQRWNHDSAHFAMALALQVRYINRAGERRQQVGSAVCGY